ncbi:PASTA domain-containing protein [Streptomyces sp. NPDC060064]|uniref:PASTA domain-containing protein n=1 Tax=Streptomyces sp. NPDC060064 TaxID=3347049 RepID=UPI0036CE5988
MRTRRIAALVTAAACLSLTACKDTTASTPTATKTVAQAPAAGSADDSSADAPAEETIAVPDFVGMGLQEAQDAAQAKGFFLLKSHDNTGAGRMQVLDRNWKVCDQNYPAGKTIPAGTELDFGSVKLSETCP